jgi:hypothetical protein
MAGMVLTRFVCISSPNVLGNTRYEKHRDTVEASRETRQLALLRAADVHHHLGCIYARDATDRDTKEEREKYTLSAIVCFSTALCPFQMD